MAIIIKEEYLKDSIYAKSIQAETQNWKIELFELIRTEFNNLLRLLGSRKIILHEKAKPRILFDTMYMNISSRITSSLPYDNQYILIDTEDKNIEEDENALEKYPTRLLTKNVKVVIWEYFLLTNLVLGNSEAIRRTKKHLALMDREKESKEFKEKVSELYENHQTKGKRYFLKNAIKDAMKEYPEYQYNEGSDEYELLYDRIKQFRSRSNKK